MARVETSEGSVPTARPKRGPSLEIDLALSAFEAATTKPEYRKPFVETPTRQSLEAVRLAEEETRLAQGGKAGGKTSEVSEVTSIATLDSIGRGEAPASGVSVHPAADDRVAAMRDLYVQGETDAALALASEVALESFGPSADREPALGLGAEPEPFDVSDPFGGLIPVEDDDLFQDLHLATFDGQDADSLFVASSPSARPRSAPRPVVASEAPSAPEEDGLVALSSLVPKMLVDPREIARLPVDPRAAFILSHVDGIQSMEEILDICPMPETEAIELMENLRLLGVISLG